MKYFVTTLVLAIFSSSTTLAVKLVDVNQVEAQCDQIVDQAKGELTELAKDRQERVSNSVDEFYNQVGVLATTAEAAISDYVDQLQQNMETKAASADDKIAASLQNYKVELDNVLSSSYQTQPVAEVVTESEAAAEFGQ